jgi:hypothetical protein
MLKDLLNTIAVNQRVQVTVWDPADDQVEHTFASFITEVGGSLFEIAPPKDRGDKIEPHMQKDLVVGIVLEAYPNPFIFYPVIHSIQKKEGRNAYWLKILDNSDIEVIQRRRHVRIPMVLPIKIEYQLGANWLDIQARTEDMSGGGMRFTSPKLFFKGQNLKVHIQFNPDLPLMRLNAKVVFGTENRVRKHPEDTYAAACQFHELEDAEEMIIVRECFRREIGMKR